MLQQDKLYCSTLALAAIYQAIALIKQFSQGGKICEVAFSASIHSIFQTDPQDIHAVFAGIDNIKFGLQILVQNHTQKNLRLNRYLNILLRLEKHLGHSSHYTQILRHEIKQVHKQVNYFSLTHPIVLNNLSDLYLKIFGTMPIKIIVTGKQRILHCPDNLNKIRALLLAGVRATVLWRQANGSRIQLLFARKKAMAMAEKILAHINLNSKSIEGIH